MQDSARTELAQTAADDELFRGGVPQPEDWLRAWRACQTPTSFHAAQEHGVTENFIHGTRRRGKVTRKGFAAMVRIMALVLRARVRQHLSAAYSICLMLDDRQAFRLTRYRCDSADGWVSGCLGVLRRGGVSSTKTVSDFDEDYSREIARSVIRCLERVGTVPGTGLDKRWLEAILQKVRIGLADGGSTVQKALRFLASGMTPRMLLTIRDRAHIARNSTRDPLMCQELFSAWYSDLFGSRHALVPDLKNSDEWREKLLVCQREVLGMAHQQGGGLTVVSRVMSFAAHRFDSCATPQRQFCCMLAAIAMMLAYVASDSRTAPASRARATTRLRELPQHVLTAGLSGTYSEECIRFIRLFDEGDHDPALTLGQKITFERRMRLLFLEGHIWTDPAEGLRVPASRASGSSGVASQSRRADGDEVPRTCPSIVLQQAKETPPIYYGDGRVVHLYSKPSKPRLQELVDGIHAVVETMLGRLDAELDKDSLENLFCVFDLKGWSKAFGKAREGTQGHLNEVRRRARLLFTRWLLDAYLGVKEMEAAACVLVTEQASSTVVQDNRKVWARVLDPDFARRQTTAGRFHALPNMVRIYLSAQDCTGGLERNLGTLKALLACHSGPLDEDGHRASELMEVYLNGPKSEEEIACRPQGVGEFGSGPQNVGEVSLVPTDFTRQCVELWVQHHGRRFRMYEHRQGHEKKRRAGTMASVSRSTAKGHNRLVQNASLHPDAKTHRTLLGIPRHGFVQRASRSGQANPASASKAMQKYRKLTNTKKMRTRALNAARHRMRKTQTNPYSSSAFNPNKRLRCGNVFEKGSAAVRASEQSGVGVFGSHSHAQLPHRSSICVANMTSSPLPIVESDCEYRWVSGWSSILEADLVLVQDVWFLDKSLPDEDALKQAFMIIAAGKVALSVSEWKGKNPHSSTSAVRFQPAAELQKATLVLCEPLASKHRSLCQIIEKCGRLPRSEWQILRNSSEGARHAVHNIASCQDARVFLQGVRCFPGSGVHGAFFSSRRSS